MSIPTVNNAFPNKNVVYLYDELNNNYKVASAESFGGPQLDNLQKTAFNELSVASLYPKIQVGFPYNINSGHVNINKTESGLSWWNNGMAYISAPSTGSNAQIITKRFLRHIPGMGGLSRFTAVFTSGRAQTKQMIGIGDRIDGFFFGYSGIDFGILKIRDGTEEWVYQPNWNVDTFNGTGKSLHKIYPESGNVYQVKYQWLGFGQISFGIENPDNGIITNVHNIKYANSNLIPSISNPSLPMSAYVENSGNALFTGTQLAVVSMGGYIEGNINESIGIRHGTGFSTTINNININNILTIKNNQTFENKPNRIEIGFDILSLNTNGNKSVSFFAIKNGQVGTGTNFIYHQSGSSPVLISTVSAPVTGGERVLQASLSVTESQIIDGNLNLELFPGEQINIAGGLVSAGGSSEVEANISWKEYF